MARAQLAMGGLGTSTQTIISCRFFSWNFFNGDWSLRTTPPPPLEWISFPPLLTAVSITPKGAESPGSRRIGVIGVLVYFLTSETV